jgi:hypothetical protein
MVGKCQGVAVGVGVVSGSEWDNCKERNVDVGWRFCYSQTERAWNYSVK